MSCQREEGKKADWNPSKKKIRGQEKSRRTPELAAEQRFISHASRHFCVFAFREVLLRNQKIYTYIVKEAYPQTHSAVILIKNVNGDGKFFFFFFSDVRVAARDGGVSRRVLLGKTRLFDGDARIAIVAQQQKLDFDDDARW